MRMAFNWIRIGPVAGCCEYGHEHASFIERDDFSE
jgi:hypothetical protein